MNGTHAAASSLRHATVRVLEAISVRDTDGGLTEAQFNMLVDDLELVISSADEILSVLRGGVAEDVFIMTEEEQRAWIEDMAEQSKIERRLEAKQGEEPEYLF